MAASPSASPAPASALPSPPTSRALWLTLAAALLAYAALLAWYNGACAAGSDSSGYLNQARLLRAGLAHPPPATLPPISHEGLPIFSFMPLGFTENRLGVISPTYPIGLPLLLVAVSECVGWSAGPGVTIWLHALAGVVLMFLLSRALGLRVPWAALAALLLAASPLYLFCSLTVMSDVPALVWTSTAVLCAWRSRTRNLLIWAAAAGAALALAVLLRPTNLLIFAPVAVALGFNFRRWLALALAGLPGALVFAAYNRAAYGGPFVTGYGSMADAFGPEFIPGNLLHYTRWLPVALTPLALLAPALPWLERNRRTALLATWVLAFSGFYLFYAFTNDAWWFLRFLLPAFPPLLTAALLVAQRWFTALPPTTSAPIFPVPPSPSLSVSASPPPPFPLSPRPRLSWALPALTLLSLAWSIAWSSRLHSLKTGRNDRYYHEATTWARDHLPANALLASEELSGALYYYTTFILVRWDHLQPDQIPALERMAATAHRPIYAALFDFEQKPALDQRMPGPWEKIGGTPRVTFWRRVTATPSGSK